MELFTAQEKAWLIDLLQDRREIWTCFDDPILQADLAINDSILAKLNQDE